MCLLCILYALVSGPRGTRQALLPLQTHTIHQLVRKMILCTTVARMHHTCSRYQSCSSGVGAPKVFTQEASSWVLCPRLLEFWWNART